MTHHLLAALFALPLAAATATAQPLLNDSLALADDSLDFVLSEADLARLADLEQTYPSIEGFDFGALWNTDMIHAYKYVNMSAIPNDYTIHLTDSAHVFCPPFIGPVRSTYHFRGRRPHRGVDIPLTMGAPVVAAFDGRVRVVQPTRTTGGYGNLVVIRHANGLETYYGHLSSQAVQPGDLVKAGDVIGYGGSTGRSTGPHLHFETRFLGQAFDPERLIDFAQGKLRCNDFTVRKHYFSIYSHYGQTDAQSLQASQHQFHVIRRGETLGTLARRYHTTVSALCRLNHISQNRTLRIGQKVMIR